MKSKEIFPTHKNGNEVFTSEDQSLNFNLLEFWTWNQSNLLENRTRGVLAEFIVKKALGIRSDFRVEWDEFDLISGNGLKIEVKSASYIQSWNQDKLSQIKFGIAPTADVNNVSEKSRKSDLYIFCLLHYQDSETINPMNLNQWTFYVLDTRILNSKLPNQKTIGLNSLMKLNPVECTFEELKEHVDIVSLP